MKIVSLGEILWDVLGAQEYLGGAPFNFAVHAGRLGHNVIFVSAVGDDERGRSALARMDQLGLTKHFVRCLPDKPTGIVSVSLDSAGQPQFTINRPAAYDFPELSEADVRELHAFQPDWIYFGTLQQTSPEARDVLNMLVTTIPRARRFYDVNLRANCYHAALVQDLLRCASVVKLNDWEVRAAEELLGQAPSNTESFCRRNAATYGWEAVCVTRGADGCAVLAGEQYVEVDGYPVKVEDTVGSGDAFAAAFLHGLDQRWDAGIIGDFANRVGAVVASRRGGIPDWTLEDCAALVRPACRE